MQIEFLIDSLIHPLRIGHGLVTSFCNFFESPSKLIFLKFSVLHLDRIGFSGDDEPRSEDDTCRLDLGHLAGTAAAKAR